MCVHNALALSTNRYLEIIQETLKLILVKFLKNFQFNVIANDFVNDFVNAFAKTLDKTMLHAARIWLLRSTNTAPQSQR